MCGSLGDPLNFISFANFHFYTSPRMTLSRPACKGLSLALFIFCRCPSTKSVPKIFLEHAVPGRIYYVEKLGSRDILTGSEKVKCVFVCVCGGGGQEVGWAIKFQSLPLVTYFLQQNSLPKFAKLSQRAALPGDPVLIHVTHIRHFSLTSHVSSSWPQSCPDQLS